MEQHSEMSATTDVQIVALDLEPSVAEVDWADQHLANLPVVVSLDDRPVEMWQSTGGQWWRKAGHILVQPSSDGARRFRIWLRAGATRADLVWLEARVAAAREGRFAATGWREARSTPGLFTFTLSKAVLPPTANSRCVGPYIVACDEALCEEYVELDGYHLAESMDDSKASIIHWQPKASKDSPVRLFRHADSTDWRAIIESEDVDAEKLARTINELQWALADLRKANGTAAA